MALSIRKRFNVFKRDNFTCTYCGRRPPDAVLQVDHRIPVVDGGGDDMDNLTTSCQSCNLGKGATPLDNTLKETRTRRRPSGPTGFAIPGYARRAALKGQAMGLLRRWSPEEARRRGREGGKASVAKAGGVDAFQERMRRGKSGEATP